MVPPGHKPKPVIIDQDTIFFARWHINQVLLRSEKVHIRDVKSLEEARKHLQNPIGPTLPLARLEKDLVVLKFEQLPTLLSVVLEDLPLAAPGADENA